MLIASVSLDFFGGHVKKGERIGIAKDYRCIYADDDGDPFIRLQMFKQGRPIDPTYHLSNCKFINNSNQIITNTYFFFQ